MFKRSRTALAFLVAAGLLAYGKSRSKDLPETDVTSGAQMYRAYCASCHGSDGKGSGPAAPALREAPTDLTQLSRRNGGEFPMFRVSRIIQGDSSVVAHGSRDMPMWGDVFRSIKRDESVVTLRVHNLARYLESLQK